MITKTEVTLRIIKEIGEVEGQNSKTFIAFDPQLNIEVVLKEFGKKELAEEPCMAIFDYYPTYFKEAIMLSKSKHPNVLPVLYAGFGEYTSTGQEDKIKTIRIATKYLKKGSFDAYLRNLYNTSGGNYPSVKEVIEYANQILQGLSHIHQQNILHLDLKPTNLLIEDNGDLVITDFGQSKFYDPFDFTIPSQYKWHLAPEILNGQQPQIETDIYHFGLTLYRICSYDLFDEQLNNYFATRVFNDAEFNQDIISGNFPNRNKYHLYVPLVLRNIINKCLEINPLNRFHNVGEILTTLNTTIKDFNVFESLENDRIYVEQNGSNYEIDINSDNTLKVYKKTISTRPLKYTITYTPANIFSKIWQIVVSLRTGKIK